MVETELEIEAFGRVQAVGFRYTIKSHAVKKRLTGFAANRDTGSVLIVAQGEKKDLEDFLVWLQTSPGFSHVSSLKYSWRKTIKEYDSFEIIRKGNIFSEQARNFYNLGKHLLGKGKAKIPVHIGIIPDGNRRWAKSQGLHSEYGHYKAMSLENFHGIISECEELGVQYLSFWGFSTENWKRSDIEVKMLFKLFFEFVEFFRKDEMFNRLRFRHAGRTDRLPKDMIHDLEKLEKDTENNKGLTITLCLDYGGRDEIVRAVNKIIKSGVKKVDEKIISENLDTAGLPDVDLVIRTSGECRTSGFMPFQSTYAELYFTDNHFPDFGADDLRKAVEWYGGRERRFGGNSK